MKIVKYILVNETGSESAVRAIHNSRVSDFRHSIIVNGKKRSHQQLIDQLVEFRRQYPDAKILGVSEIDPSATYAPIRVSEAMNQLRRELSEME